MPKAQLVLGAYLKQNGARHDEKTIAQAKEGVILTYAAQKIGAIITFAVLIASSGLIHDPAAVKHYNGKILTSFIKSVVAPDVGQWRTH